MVLAGERRDQRRAQLAAAVNPRDLLFADLRGACAAGAAGAAGGWAEPLGAAQRALLGADAAVPRLLHLVADKLGAVLRPLRRGLCSRSRRL